MSNVKQMTNKEAYGATVANGEIYGALPGRNHKNNRYLLQASDSIVWVSA